MHGDLPSALVNDETRRAREFSRTEGARGVNSRGTTLLARKQDQLPGISRLLRAWVPPTRSYLTGLKAEAEGGGRRRNCPSVRLSVCPSRKPGLSSVGRSRVRSATICQSWACTVPRSLRRVRRVLFPVNAGAGDDVVAQSNATSDFASVLRRPSTRLVARRSPVRRAGEARRSQVVPHHANPSRSPTTHCRIAATFVPGPADAPAGPIDQDNGWDCWLVEKGFDVPTGNLPSQDLYRTHVPRPRGRPLMPNGVDPFGRYVYGGKSSGAGPSSSSRSSCCVRDAHHRL